MNHCEDIFNTGNIKVLNNCLELQNVYRGYESCIKDYCKTITVASTSLEDCMYHDSKNASKWLVRLKLINCVFLILKVVRVLIFFFKYYFKTKKHI